ncbi:MAG: hypothetical protein LBR35_01090 [Rickettsiales bacterium]|jgi:gas vesicle protein|nr:hypothetical protein [Rickettsiales bacterium]
MKNKLINILIYAVCLAVAGLTLNYSGQKLGKVYINETTGQVKTVVGAVISSIEKEGKNSINFMANSLKDSGKAMEDSAKASVKAIGASAKDSVKNLGSEAAGTLVSGLFSGKGSKEIADDGKKLVQSKQDNLKSDVKAQQQSLKDEIKNQEDKLKNDLKKAFNVEQVEQDVKDAVIVAALEVIKNHAGLLALVIVSLFCSIALVYLLVKNIVLFFMLAVWGTGKGVTKGATQIFKKKK